MIRFPRCLTVAMPCLLSLLVACGGGDSAPAVAAGVATETTTPAPNTGAAPAPPAPVTPTLAGMVDSFGRVLAESEFGGGGPRAAGIDGTAADGLPLANAQVWIVDSDGNRRTARTDAQGYYRARVDDLRAPLLVTVQRPDGTTWQSPSVAAVRTRGFVTVNITPLTDWLASEVAAAASLAQPGQLTAGMVAANLAVLNAARERLRALLTSQLAEAGLPAATFDPVTLPFRADHTGYDAVLDQVSAIRNTAGFTTLQPKIPVAGSIAGLGTATGLVLANGTERLLIASGAMGFRFAARLAAGSAYAVTIAQQPNGRTCAVNDGSGTIPVTPATQPTVVCTELTWTVGGSVSGLGTATGLVLTTGSEWLDVPPGATGFRFARALPAGTSFRVEVSAQPANRVCSVSAGAGAVSAANIDDVSVSCSITAVMLSGLIEGLITSGLKLEAAGQLITVAPNATAFSFAPIAVGTPYDIQVQSQPQDAVCTVTGGSGTLTASTNTAQVRCTPAFQLRGTVTGMPVSANVPLTLETGGQTVNVNANGSPTVDFVFPQRLAPGTPYDIRVTSVPSTMTLRTDFSRGRRCEVTSGRTGVVSATTAPIAVRCIETSRFTVNVDGAGPIQGLVVGFSTGERIPVSGRGSITSNVYLDDGTPWSFWVEQQPAASRCVLVNETNRIAGQLGLPPGIQCNP